jgi:hypothetical protein
VRCGSDTEMMYRMQSHGIEVKKLKERLFIRVVNRDSLTNCDEYGKESEYRKERWKLIKQRYGI